MYSGFNASVLTSSSSFSSSCKRTFLSFDRLCEDFICFLKSGKLFFHSTLIPFSFNIGIVFTIRSLNPNVLSKVGVTSSDSLTDSSWSTALFKIMKHRLQAFILKSTSCTFFFFSTSGRSTPDRSIYSIDIFCHASCNCAGVGSPSNINASKLWSNLQARKTEILQSLARSINFIRTLKLYKECLQNKIYSV